jgi:hypothetical protein
MMLEFREAARGTEAFLKLNRGAAMSSIVTRNSPDRMMV